MRALRITALLALVANVACERTGPPRSQLVLHVTTDAPLPFSPVGACPSQPSDVPPLFDTIELAVFPSGRTTPCDHCVRRFAIDCRMVEDGKASIGIVPGIGDPNWRARIRIYRGIAVADGEPIPSATLETVVALPAIFEDSGVVDVTATVHTARIGQPEGTLDSPVTVTTGDATKGIVGSWSAAKRVACTANATIKEACVPGGAFWMGNPAVGAMLASFDANVPRLVVISPFIVDLAEVTVDSFRQVGIARLPNPNTSDNGDPFDNAGAIGGPCTYSGTSASTTEDAMPVNCLTWGKAQEYCATQQKALLTEAQFEWLASGLRGGTYPWGEDEPSCADVDFAHGATPTIPQSCPPQLIRSGGAGQGARDRIRIGNRDVIDLVGSLREWTRDVFAEQTEACWTQPLLVDPECTSGGRANARTVRGGSWRDQAGFLRAATRHFGFANGDKTSSGTFSPYIDDYGTNGATIGFRCMRPAN